MIGRLGKRPVKRDARNLKFAAYLPEAPVLPSAIDWSPAVKGGFPMFLNDRIGDCTAAAAAHMTQIWTANTGQVVPITDKDVEAAYEVVGKYNPADPATDNGAAELDVLNYWRTTGIGWNKISAFVQIAPGSRTELKAGIAWFGGVYMGFLLPASILGQTVWDVVSGDDGGELGGHAVNGVAFDDVRQIVTVITWGQKQEVTYKFIDTYCDEMYAVLSPDWLNSEGTAPSQLDISGLQSDLLSIPKL